MNDEERALQIELTRIQLEHEHAMSRHTLFISLFVTLIVTILSVYVPLGVLAANLFYLIFATVYASALVIPVYLTAKRMAEKEKQLQEEIKKLQNKYVRL